LTFTTELDDLIRFGHGDLTRLRNIRDTVKHDNFITIEDKKYVESLISTHLRNQPLDESEPQVTRKLAPKRSVSTDSSTFNFSNNKKLGITAGVAAAIALIVVAGFSMQTMDQTDTSTSSETITTSNIPLVISADSTSYKKADIISISGSLKSTGTLKKEDWQPNGSLKAILEIPAAARPNVIDRLGAITKGTAFVEVIK